MRGDTEAPVHVPMMRALLFTDLCGSTMLVERLGDSAAAALFQQHDRLVLALQQRWRGQQIDRSDGLFLLFERPVDALGFALDYQQQLRELGRSHTLDLQACAGLHIGEVILWNNSAEAIAHGAKPVEVEGLAKPMAARLMQLARPGQILLSAAAESMVRRAADDLGEAGKGLKWKSFGRWRLKGVAQPMEVLGVQAATMPKAGRPRETTKAMRDVPFWRRPLAMAAEITLAVALAIGLWFLLRPQPAIAFAERDWVVMADVRNLTDNPLLDEGIDQALRISLEQSRYVNVLSDLKARDTMARMLMPEEGVLDRRTAVQIAMRDGARAVLDPSIREVHGQLRVSMDVVNPSNGETVYTVYSDGKGLASALTSSDQVVIQLRARLGEAMAQIGKTSAPLPQVATANLDALNAYAKGQAVYGSNNVRESLKYFKIATQIDPGFAMAWLAQMRILVSLGKRDDARTLIENIERLSSRLSTKEKLYLDAWKAELFSTNESAGLEAWKTLADLYPDHHGARVNHAWAAFLLGRYGEAEQAVKAADVPQNPLRPVTLHLLGRIQLAQENIAGALATQRQALSLSNGRPNRHMVAALAASGDMESAARMLADIPAPDAAHWLEGILLDLDSGRLDEAVDKARAASRNCGESISVCELLSVVSLSTQAAAGRCAAASEFTPLVGRLLKLAGDPTQDDRGQRLFFAAAAMYAAQRMGYWKSVSQFDEELTSLSDQIGDERNNELTAVVGANQRRLEGDAAAAVQRLLPLVRGQELFQTHSVLAAAFAELGDSAGEQQQLRWLRGHRGRAYGEASGSAVLSAMNVRDSTHHSPVAGCATRNGTRQQ